MKKIVFACVLTALVFWGISMALTRKRERLVAEISAVEEGRRRVVETRGPQDLRDWASEQASGTDDLLLAMERLSVLTRPERRRFLEEFIGDIWLGHKHRKMETALVARSAKEDSLWFLNKVLELGPDGYRFRKQQYWTTCAMRSLLDRSPGDALAFAERVLDMQEKGDSLPLFRFRYLILNHLLKNHSARAADYFVRGKLGFGFSTTNEAIKFDSVKTLDRFQKELLREGTMDHQTAEGTMAFLAGRAFEIGGIESARAVLDRVAKNFENEKLIVKILSHEALANRLMGEEGGGLVIELTQQFSDQYDRSNALNSFAVHWSRWDLRGFTNWVRGLEPGDERDSLLGVAMQSHVSFGDRTAFREMLELVDDRENLRVKSALGRYRRLFSEEPIR